MVTLCCRNYQVLRKGTVPPTVPPSVPPSVQPSVRESGTNGTADGSMGDHNLSAPDSPSLVRGAVGCASRKLSDEEVPKSEIQSSSADQQGQQGVRTLAVTTKPASSLAHEAGTSPATTTGQRRKPSSPIIRMRSVSKDFGTSDERIRPSRMSRMASMKRFASSRTLTMSLDHMQPMVKPKGMNRSISEEEPLGEDSKKVDVESMVTVLRNAAYDVAANHLVIPVNSYFRSYWDGVILVLVLYEMAMVPLTFSFEELDGNGLPLIYRIFDRLIYACFCVDLILNFFTTHYVGELEITSNVKLAKRYV